MGEGETRQALAFLRGVPAQLASGLVNFIYPPVCSGCGRFSARDGAVCPSCWQTIRFIERPYCEVMGTPFTHDLGPGILSAQAIAHPPVFDRLRAVAAHDGICQTLVHRLKYNDRLDLAPLMARWMARAAGDLLSDADVIVPVPLHRTRLFTRRFNQSAELARHLALQCGKPFNAVDLKRVRRTAHQVGLGERAREDNVRGAFAVSDAGKMVFSGRRVLLVDDVYTTGATVTAASRALRRAGVGDITVLVFSMALPEPI
ncbi:ComF family protein [Rhizobium sp. C1]|uniref:ComF family protein n=1 Tax=Rhizobium sp. C1 TaxID=1349799 RepID=UPI001E5EC94D|nr:ComF family protein [Rhizobium sp. C1]MCD2179387.1 ComF family protein [Rhizobium sp. C1]